MTRPVASVLSPTRRSRRAASDSGRAGSPAGRVGCTGVSISRSAADSSGATSASSGRVAARSMVAIGTSPEAEADDPAGAGCAAMIRVGTGSTEGAESWDCPPPESRCRFGGSGGGWGINGRVASGAPKTRVRSSPSRFGV